MDVLGDAGCAESVPVGDVLLVEVWVVLGVVVEVVADGNADGRWIGFFERDGEMVWHLVLSRRHSLPLVGYCPPPPHRPRRPRRPRRIINACRIGSFFGLHSGALNLPLPISPCPTSTSPRPSWAGDSRTETTTATA